jgi:hypothetical protein
VGQPSDAADEKDEAKVEQRKVLAPSAEKTDDDYGQADGRFDQPCGDISKVCLKGAHGSI